MKKNIVIVCLTVIVLVFGYLGICAHREAVKLENELVLTQKALYFTGKRLEEWQWAEEWPNDPHYDFSNGLYKYQDFYQGNNQYKMRLIYCGTDIPLWFDRAKKVAMIADSYDGFDWDLVPVEFSK